MSTTDRSNRHDEFIAALEESADAATAADVSRFFRADPASGSEGNRVLGVRFATVFATAKQFVDMPLPEIERLLESPFYEVRMGAVSIMDFQARAKRTPAEQRKALFELYLRRHDRIDNWDLVDRAAPSVVGGFLLDRPRDVLYGLARSANPWERRTAIVSTYAFLKQGETEETFRIAELLIGDPHDLVQKAVGSWVREAGKRDEARLLRFLQANAAKMPRAALRYATEKLPPAVRAGFLS